MTTQTTTPPILWGTLVTLLIMADMQWSLCYSTELRTGHQQFKSRAASGVHTNSIFESVFSETRGRAVNNRFNLEVAGAKTTRVLDINENNSSKEVNVLLAFKSGITSDPKGALHSWREDSSDPCSWSGVGCSSTSTHVTGLNLRGSSLEGTVSASLGQLSFLEHFDLSNNFLNGSIPTSLANCSNLIYLNISFNQISGDIPALVGNLDKLQTLDLSNNSISGVIPATIGNCSSLQALVLGTNSLQGDIPSEIGFLSNLRILDLSYCTLSGHVPLSFGNCSSLHHLNFGFNPSLGGELPIELGKLLQLQQFYAEHCNFYGSFPTWAFNITSMQRLNLGANQISGPIPEEVGNFPNLTYLGLYINVFTGEIPKSIGNLTSLQTLYLNQNQLTGSIPRDLGLLTNLKSLFLYNNALTGIIPSSLSNCSLIKFFQLGSNNFDAQPFPHWIVSLRNIVGAYLASSNLQGTLPNEIGQLSQLYDFPVFMNNLTGAIPPSMANCTGLFNLDIGDNQLSGEIPSDLGRLTGLHNIYLDYNAFAGQFPAVIYNLSTQLAQLDVGYNQFNGMLDGDFGGFGQLTAFGVNNNYFQGPIPYSISNCSQLTILDMTGNKFSGGLPPALANLTKLSFLGLSSNQLDGAIPMDFLRNLRLMQEFHLNDNNLGGPIPVDIGHLFYLQRFNMSGNSFIGSLPDSLANCTQLLSFDLSHNQLSGSLPGDALAAMIYLTMFNISRNSFSGSWPPQISLLKNIQVINISDNLMSGSIPSGLGGLGLLESLDVSFNQFTGQIPADLGLLTHLVTFNASYNNFSGPIPDSGSFKSNLTAASFLGDPDLCGGILGPQRRCPSSPARKSHCRGFKCEDVWIPVASVLGAMILFLIIGVLFVILSGQTKNETVHRGHKDVMYTFYPNMRFLESDILAAITPGQDNVIGVGGQSVVYKGLAPGGEAAAIKVSRNVQDTGDQDAAEKTLWEVDIAREASTLGQLRHRNIIRVFCVFFNLEVSCIVMEYMPKGSLHEHLQRDAPNQLTWAQRFKILAGVTHGMVYLHHEFPDPIIHRDLKASNILLDEDLEPKLCDFGISRYVTNDKGEATASTICGTVGYIPPEYGTGGRLSTKGDVYSYGVVLLELLTSKAVAAERTNMNPSSQKDLVSTVQKAVESNIQSFELLDPALQSEGNDNAITREQLMLTMRVGVLCTRALPENRPSMNDVLQMLLQIEQLGQENVAPRALDDLVQDA